MAARWDGAIDGYANPASVQRSQNTLKIRDESR